MDIQNSKHHTIISKLNNRPSIRDSETKLLKLKIQVMQIVCRSFYPNQHRCILSFIAACTLENVSVQDEDLSIFLNYESLIIDLKEGYFLTSYEINSKRNSRQNRKDKKILFYKLDFHKFFIIIDQILKELQTKLKKIKQFYIESEKIQVTQGEQRKTYKRCKNCHTKKNLHLELFGFDSCQKCQGNDFQEVLISQKQKNRIDKLNEIIIIVFTKLKQIRNLESGLQIQIEEIQQRKESKVNELDLFLTPYLQILKDKKENLSLQKNFRTIKLAEKLQAPSNHYLKVEQMILSRKKAKAKGKTENETVIKR